MSIQKKSKVLIVDDHELVRKGLRLLIDGEPDMEVCCEAETIHKVKSMKQHIAPDIAVLDISLPDGSGLDLAKNLHQWRPQMGILMLSMYEDALFAERALSVGATGYINKQNSADKIIQAIRQVISNKTYLGKRMTERLSQQSSDSLKRLGSTPVEILSAREMQVLEMIGQGLSTVKIAKNLILSVKTVETYRANIKQKLHLETASELMRYAVIWSLENG